MIIYKSTKREFINNAMASPREGKNIANLIKAEFEKRIGKVNDAEYKSWQNSLRHMAYVVDTDDIADEASVCIEFRLPFQSCRIDFLIAGKDEEEKENVVIVELKQWASATSLADKNLVRTVINGGERNVPHPSYQAWSYAVTLQEYNECVQKDGVLLHPCAFMHNYVPLRDDPIIDNLVYREIDKAPLFTCHDAESLRKYIASKVCLKDDGNLIYRIDYGRIKPSKSLQDVLGKMLDKNKEGNEFVLIDSQKSVFEFIMAEVSHEE